MSAARLILAIAGDIALDAGRIIVLVSVACAGVELVVGGMGGGRKP
jgi:hypothetical protein